jgi:hypothetical protein
MQESKSTTWSEELRAAHLALSPQDLKFRELAKDDPRFLARSTFEPLRANPDLLEYSLQSWPTFLGGPKREELHQASLSVAELLKRIPERVFGNDPVAIAKFYRLPDPGIAELLLTSPNGIAGAVARGDFIARADGFKCLEFNVSTLLGGWETAPLVGLHLTVPPTAGFLRDEGIPNRFTNTFHELWMHIIRETLAAGLSADGTLTVAVLRDPDYTANHAFQAYTRRVFGTVCAESGRVDGELTECRPDELRLVRGSLYHRRRRIDAVLELCRMTPPHVYRAFKTERIVLFNGPMSRLLGDKRNIALLSESLETEIFEPEERERIRCYIPWTRRVLLQEVEFHSEKAPLRNLLLARRDELVLKEALSYGGKGVAIGEFTPPATWESLVDRALTRVDSVVQERLNSLPYLYQHGVYGAEICDMIWGPFLFGRTYGGLFLRTQPKAARNVVNLTQAATEGTVFEV